MSKARPLIMYAVYRQPADYPSSFVVRRWFLWSGRAVADQHPLAVTPTLELARAAIPDPLLHFPRQPADDPAIVETWY